MCEKCRFDGVDMDWEYPWVGDDNARWYEALVLTLPERLHAQGKFLTGVVLRGATADGNIYYDASAQTNAVF